MKYPDEKRTVTMSRKEWAELLAVYNRDPEQYRLQHQIRGLYSYLHNAAYGPCRACLDSQKQRNRRHE